MEINNGAMIQWKDALLRPVEDGTPGLSIPEVFPSMFSPDGRHLIAEIVPIYEGQVGGLVIWCQEDESGSYATIKSKTSILAYALSNTMPELVAYFSDDRLVKYNLTNSYRSINEEILTPGRLPTPFDRNQMVFSTNANLLMLSTEHGMITVLDGDKGYTLVTSFQTGGNRAKLLAFGMNNTIIAKAMHQPEVELWDVHTGALKDKLVVKGHFEIKRCLQFSPNGEYLVAIVKSTRVNTNNIKRSGLWHYHLPTGRSYVMMVYGQATGAGCNDITSWCLGADVLYEYTMENNSVKEITRFPSTVDMVLSSDKSTLCYRLEDWEVRVARTVDIALPKENVQNNV